MRGPGMGKRGGPNEAEALDHVQIFTGPIDLDLVALDQALDRLAKIDELQVKGTPPTEQRLLQNGKEFEKSSLRQLYNLN